MNTLVIIALAHVVNHANLDEFPKWTDMQHRTGLEVVMGHQDPTPIMNRVHASGYYSHGYYEDHSGYWKSPEEFDKDGWGDCMDYAISDYYRAIQKGADRKAIDILVGELPSKELHAIVRVQWKGKTTYWDNNSPKPYYKLGGFKKIYSINNDGWKQYSNIKVVPDNQQCDNQSCVNNHVVASGGTHGKR